MAPLYGEQRSSSVAGVYISAEQEKEISLILAEASIQKIEKWVRIAGSLDPEKKVVSGRVYGKDIELIREGQKVHIYPLIARQPVLQGKVARTFLDGEELIVETDLQPKLYEGVQLYIMEIIVDFGRHLSVPNEAIIEEKGRRLIYVQQEKNHYAPKELVSGIRGELYTQVLDGLEPGEKVVTFGSFFIDAHYKLQHMNERTVDLNSEKEGSFAHHNH
jgi:multidrug efflux pump subunit AcrA (membrane-fusion protein)